MNKSEENKQVSIKQYLKMNPEQKPKHELILETVLNRGKFIGLQKESFWKSFLQEFIKGV